MSNMHPAIKTVRERITARSRASRELYLSGLPTSPPDRSRVGCANMAHATAVLESSERKLIAMARSPHLGVVTAYNDMLSAHQPFASYPALLGQAARARGATLQVAGGVPAMCDGITQGREGMELSLLSRDVIAMSTVVSLSHDVFDAVVLLGVCDKIAPGLLLGALAYGHLPAVFIPAGPMPSGLSNSEKSRIRQLAAQGKADRATLLAAEEASYHSPGTCTFYGTANSNQLMLDLMGLQFPGGAFTPPQAPERSAQLRDSVRALIQATGNKMLSLGQLVNERSIVNALVGLLATGGSTNHAIHWIAVARAAGILIDWTDLDDLSRATPLLTRIYPNGSSDVNALHQAGGTAAIGRWLIEHQLIDGDAPTVWGTTLATTLGEPALDAAGNWAPTPPPQHSRDDSVLRRPKNAFQSDGGLRLLAGNLGRSVAKVSAVKTEHRLVEAPCRVFDGQSEVLAAFDAGELNRDVVVVVRFQGPKANGMPELHKLTPALGVLQDNGFKVALVTDGRMSGASGKVLAAIHVTPEASAGGPLSQIRDGDLIRVDALAGDLTCNTPLAGRPCMESPKSGISHGRHYFEMLRSAMTGAEQGASFLYQE